MHSIGLPELIIVLGVGIVAAAVVILPVSIILRRIGYSPFLSIAAVVPLLNLALLWFVAISRWPGVEQRP